MTTTIGGLPETAPALTKPPVLLSATVNASGTSLALFFSRPVVSVDFTAGFTVTADGSAVTISNPVNSDRTVTFTVGQITEEQKVLLSYSAAAGDVAAGGLDLADIYGLEANNLSGYPALTPPAPGSTYYVGTNAGQNLTTEGQANALANLGLQTPVVSASLVPADFTIAPTYFNSDWTRKAATSATQSPVGLVPIQGDEGTLIAKITVNTANTTDGFLIGFGGSVDSRRMLVGYEPALSQRGFVFFNGGTSTFTRILPDAPSGVYYVRVSKRGLSFIAQVASDEAFTTILGQTSVTSSLIPNQTPRISAKMPTASFSLAGYVKYSEKALAHPNTPAKAAVTGKQVIVTRFNGESNNWCFVRTPYSYSNDGEPRPMVILNHGNGWVMDGTLAKANFSEKTQFGVDTQNGGTYLDTGRSDYVQYSNPLIELLLANGFVVCGAQNYADTLYGNKNCRNAVADFYQWMRRNFNVRERCYMVGASNGMMTTLNACHVLGTAKVAATAGVYPLCDLIDHYLGYSPHRAGIEAAYSLTPPYADKAALMAESKLFSHCPVNHYVVGSSDSTTVRTQPLPPTRLVVSTGDTVVAPANNGTKLRDLMNRSFLVCQYLDIDPTGGLGYDHGDWHHFREQEIVDFFLANK